MADYGADNPYKTLGWHLKFAREQLKKSLDEVSGAVEIDTDVLKKIEQGDQCPSEDVLLLLISHLCLEDAEATSLWELAGYTGKEKDLDTQLNAVMPTDLRIIYADMLHVAVNDYGVVMNFMQGGGPGNQPLAVARVGMSKEHANRVMEMLQASLKQTKPKARPKYLPAPKNHKDATDVNG